VSGVQRLKGVVYYVCGKVTKIGRGRKKSIQSKPSLGKKDITDAIQRRISAAHARRKESSYETSTARVIETGGQKVTSTVIGQYDAILFFECLRLTGQLRVLYNNSERVCRCFIKKTYGEEKSKGKQHV
jgi:hypothetical protein